MSEPIKQKRPTSHRYAIAFFGFVTLMFIYTLMRSFQGYSGAVPGQFAEALMFSSLGFLVLVMLILGGQSRYVYYVSSGVIAIYGVRAISNFVWYLCHFISQRGPSNVAPTLLITSGALTGLLVLLFYCFTFGHPSRKYYGFDKAKQE